MKKSAFTKIFVLIFSLALLIGSVVCVAASADESDEYTIEAINISHGDKIRVLIAVDAPVEAAEDLVVKYTYAGEEYVAKYWKNDAIYGDKTLYPIFYTVGIAAKDMGENVTAWVGEDNSDARDVSVVSYLYNRLYREGFITKTEGKDANRKELYLRLLDYGARAQQVLWNNVEGNEPRTLVTDYSYVSVTDGSINDGGSTALVAGDVTVDYTGTSPDFRGWDITAYIDGEAVTSRSYKSQLKMEAGISFTATPYMNANLFHFENFAVGTGLENVGDSTATSAKFTGISSDGLFSDVVKVQNSGSIFGLNSYAKVVEDGDNKVLAIKSTGRTPASARPPQAILYTGTAANFANDIAASSATVMECDMKFISSSCTSGSVRSFQIVFHQRTSTGSGPSATNSTFNVFISGGNVTMQRNGVAGTITLPKLSDNEWVNLRAEYTKATSELKIFIDGVEAFTTTMNYTAGDALLYDMTITPYDGWTAEMYIDNYSFEHIPAAE